MWPKWDMVLQFYLRISSIVHVDDDIRSLKSEHGVGFIMFITTSYLEGICIPAPFRLYNIT